MWLGPLGDGNGGSGHWAMATVARAMWRRYPRRRQVPMATLSRRRFASVLVRAAAHRGTAAVCVVVTGGRGSAARGRARARAICAHACHPVQRPSGSGACVGAAMQPAQWAAKWLPIAARRRLRTTPRGRGLWQSSRACCVAVLQGLPAFMGTGRFCQPPTWWFLQPSSCAETRKAVSYSSHRSASWYDPQVDGFCGRVTYRSSRTARVECSWGKPRQRFVGILLGASRSPSPTGANRSQPVTDERDLA